MQSKPAINRCDFIVIVIGTICLSLLAVRHIVDAPSTSSDFLYWVQFFFASEIVAISCVGIGGRHSYHFLFVVRGPEEIEGFWDICEMTVLKNVRFNISDALNHNSLSRQVILGW